MRWNQKQTGTILLAPALALALALGACASRATEVSSGRPAPATLRAPAAVDRQAAPSGSGPDLGSLPPGWEVLQRPTDARVGGRKGRSVLIGEPARVAGATERSVALFLYDPSEDVSSVEGLAAEVKPGVHGRVVAAGRGLLVHLDADIEVPRPDGKGVRVDSAWVARLPGGQYAQVMASGLREDEVRDLVQGLR